MSKRFHIGPNGPGEHYNSEKEADAVYQKRKEAQSSDTMVRRIPELPTGILSPARTDAEGNITRPALTYEEYYASTNKKHFGDTTQPGSQFTAVNNLSELVKVTKNSHGGTSCY